MSYSKQPRSAAARRRKIALANPRPICFERLEGRTMLSTVSINTDARTITGPFNSGTIYGVPYTSAAWRITSRCLRSRETFTFLRATA